MSVSSKDAILARIRAANGAAGADPAADADAAYAALPRDYLRAHHDAGIVALFAERAADYRAVVERVHEPGLASVREFLDEFWPARLDELKRAVESDDD